MNVLSSIELFNCRNYIYVPPNECFVGVPCQEHSRYACETFIGCVVSVPRVFPDDSSSDKRWVAPQCSRPEYQGVLLVPTPDGPRTAQQTPQPHQQVANGHLSTVRSSNGIHLPLPTRMQGISDATPRHANKTGASTGKPRGHPEHEHRPQPTHQIHSHDKTAAHHMATTRELTSEA